MGQRLTSWGGKAQRIPPRPDLGHASCMPDYRRNRVPGATYFFRDCVAAGLYPAEWLGGTAGLAETGEW
jgi:hypothetical protein